VDRPVSIRSAMPECSIGSEVVLWEHAQREDVSRREGSPEHAPSTNMLETGPRRGHDPRPYRQDLCLKIHSPNLRPPPGMLPPGEHVRGPPLGLRRNRGGIGQGERNQQESERPWCERLPSATRMPPRPEARTVSGAPTEPVWTWRTRTDRNDPRAPRSLGTARPRSSRSSLQGSSRRLGGRRLRPW